jgi:hypothetical protein
MPSSRPRPGGCAPSPSGFGRRPWPSIGLDRFTSLLGGVWAMLRTALAGSSFVSALASANVGALCRLRLRPRMTQARARGFGCVARAPLRDFGRVGSGAESGWQRQEGKGRSDAVRLLMRGTLRRVRFAARGRPRPRQGALGCTGSWKPETRRTPESSAGCNKPAAPVWRKLPRW